MATNLGMEKHLHFILNEKNIWNSLILICVSLGEPWEMEECINQALHLVEDHINQMQELYAIELEELQSSRKMCPFLPKHDHRLFQLSVNATQIICHYFMGTTVRTQSSSELFIRQKPCL